MYKVINEVFVPDLMELIMLIRKNAWFHGYKMMLAKTYGRPTAPTTFGKELSNFNYRLERKLN